MSSKRSLLSKLTLFKETVNESSSCVGVGVKFKDFVLSTELIRCICRQIRKKIEKLTFQALRPVTKILETLADSVHLV